MVSKRIVAGAAALALALSPTAAAAQAAAPLPAAEEVEGSELRGRRWVHVALPLVIIAILLMAVLKDGGEDGPASP